MRKYETVVVFRPTLAEKQAQEESAKVKTIIEEKGGRDIEIDSWGKREMAFQVKKHKHGWYVCFYYASEQGDIVDELTSLLRIEDNIVLFQTHRLSDKVRKFKGRSGGADSEGTEVAV